MRLLSRAALVLILFLIPQAALAGHQLENGFPVELVSAAKDVRPQSLGIAWSGSVYGIVFDDYASEKNKTGSFFMVVRPDGKVISGPVRLSKKKYGSHPKIAWTDGDFMVLHQAGKKLKGGGFKIKYYLARFNSAGNKLGENTLDATPGSELYGIHNKLVWNGKELGIFMLADIYKENLYSVLAFCKADAKGVPGKSKAISTKFDQAGDVIWDGSRYVLFGVHRLSYESSKQVPSARIMLIDGEGEVIDTQYYKKIASADEFLGASIVATHKKNVYLLAFGTLSANVGVSPTAHLSDVYATQLRISGGKYKGFKPQNITKGMSDDWSFPTILRDGKKYYFTANLGTAGCDFAFAEMSLNGKIASKPVEYMVLRPTAGAAPPYPVMSGKVCGIVFVDGALMLHRVKP